MPSNPNFVQESADLFAGTGVFDDGLGPFDALTEAQQRARQAKFLERWGRHEKLVSGRWIKVGGLYPTRNTS